jgi:hypothetical protein
MKEEKEQKKLVGRRSEILQVPSTISGITLGIRPAS